MPHCQACNKHYADYVVWDSVWNECAFDDPDVEEITSLCVECLEVDLGRAVVASDFTGNPLNAVYIRHCDRCDVLFRPRHDKQWYCSADCGKAAGWEKKQTCDFCSRRFTPTRKSQRFCGADCAYASRQKDLIIRPCANCGKPFDTFNPRQKFCCVECCGASKAVKHETTQCACGCGETFTPKRKDQRYASRACVMRHARAMKKDSPGYRPPPQDWLPGCGEIIA